MAVAPTTTRLALGFLGAIRVASLLAQLTAALGVFAAVSGAAADWNSGAGFRWRSLEVAPSGQPGFSLLAPAATGVAFTNAIDERSGAANRVLYNGSGVAAGDYDGDGWPDVFLCDLGGTNRLFRNLGGWRFQDVTLAAGLGVPCPLSRGAVFADLNGDGRPDLLVSVTGRGVLCFLNDGRGGFRDATETAGTASRAGSTTMALADVNGDGTLDLYVTNYRPDDIRDRGRAKMTVVNGRPIMAGTETNRFVFVNGRLEECGQPDQLLLNDGTARFSAVSWTDGTFRDVSGQPLEEPPRDWGLTATFRDVNGDLAPDLYVCNDYWTPDRFWINDGRGHFQAIARTALRRTSASSMSVDFADIDRDGYVDFFVVDMLSRYPALRKRQMFAQTPMGASVGVTDDRPQVVQNTLFLNRHDGTFAEIADFAGLAASDWSWAPVFLDVDLDGYEDLVIGAGHFRDVQDYDAEARVRARQHSWEGFTSDAERQRAFTQELMEHNRLYPLLRLPLGGFRNLGGCRFAEVTEQWGLNHPGVHQGLAMADFDQDGDLDLVVNNLNDSASLYRNEGSAGRVAVRLKGKAPNTQGIGAKVTLGGGAVREQTSEVICGGRYQSGADIQVAFATGTALRDMTIEVRWRGGMVSRIARVERNRLYEIEEGAVEPEPVPLAPKESPLFEDASRGLAHRHFEVPFDDFERQPLLPFKLSQLGPGVAWTDLDGDGHEDLVIGAGRGGSPAAFRGDGQGGFKGWPWPTAWTVQEDLAGLTVWSDTATNLLLSAVTGYEAAGASEITMFRADAGRMIASTAAGPSIASTASVLAIGDPAGDGCLALFIGGGVLPGQYPLGAPSRLFRLSAGQWRFDARNSGVLANLGIVNGAVWSDLDGDGLAELVLACEWGPVRAFKMQGGGLFEVTREMGLQQHVGWWRGVTTGDLNNDGRMDIIAANWGLNSPYQASAERPLIFVFGQLAQPGTTDVIETEWVGEALAPRRQWQVLASSLPFLTEAFTTHRAYSEATVEQVLGERLALSRRVSATTLASTVFLNTGAGFNAMPLPREAQFAPAFAVCVTDFDGDGNEDVFLSQNFSATPSAAARLDAGTGLLLRGDGAGQLTAVSAARSGIRIEGEQRGAAVADFDEDGRPDLVVTQNGAATRLFRNASGQPGLRVRLEGPAGNAAALGAVVRLQRTLGLGPARELHSGSGYWSQDSLTQVMGRPGEVAGVWVRWPGGLTTTTALPVGATEITIDVEGHLLPHR